MNSTRNIFLFSFTILVAASAVVSAKAKTVTIKTIVKPKELPNTKKVDFAAFDLNGDNVLSMTEAGEKLFYIFDTDGNEVIDNTEFDHKQVMTIIPMEKQVFTFVDYDDDGQEDRTTYTYEEFIDQSHLMRFDDEMDGLSPADFIERNFLELDGNKSTVIEVKEWKEAYLAKVLPHTDQERYN